MRKTLPTLIQKRTDLENLHERMNGLIFDVEYSVDAVKTLGNSDEHFNVKFLFENNQSNLFFFRALLHIWKNRVISVNK